MLKHLCFDFRIWFAAFMFCFVSLFLQIRSIQSPIPRSTSHNLNSWISWKCPAVFTLPRIRCHPFSPRASIYGHMNKQLFNSTPFPQHLFVATCAPGASTLPWERFSQRTVVGQALHTMSAHACMTFQFIFMIFGYYCFVSTKHAVL